MVDTERLRMLMEDFFKVSPHEEETAALIAEMRNALPELIEENTRLKQQVRTLEGAIDVLFEIMTWPECENCLVYTECHDPERRQGGCADMLRAYAIRVGSDN